MASRTKYRTKQRDILVEFFNSSPGVHFTANDICEHMKACGESIGQSTIYRRLEELVDEGILSKYSIDANTPACFEYIGKDSHNDSGTCFHCKCEKCGTLIHMHCDEMESISEHLMGHHGFRLNSMRTVFYGICKDCMQEDESRV